LRIAVALPDLYSIIFTGRQVVNLETNISGHNTDIIMKATAEMFKDKTLEILGLKTARIVDIMPTVLPVVEAREKRLDFVFLLEDETLLHLEFQTTVPEDLLRRIAFYGARIVERHNREVNTAIIYSGRIQNAPDLLTKGSLTYKVANVYLKDMDGDAECNRLKAKIDQEEPLNEADLQKLVFLPLMKSKQPENDMVIQAAELAKVSKNEYTNFAIGALIAITDKFLPEEYKRKLLEVLRMTQIEQWLREEGLKEGLKEGKLETARKALLKGVDVEFIAEITGLSLETIQKLKNEIVVKQ
jgi:predicted transposase/invertase (TIGR01784 family)